MVIRPEDLILTERAKSYNKETVRLFQEIAHRAVYEFVRKGYEEKYMYHCVIQGTKGLTLPRDLSFSELVRVSMGVAFNNIMKVRKDIEATINRQTGEVTSHSLHNTPNPLLPLDEQWKALARREMRESFIEEVERAGEVPQHLID